MYFGPSPFTSSATIVIVRHRWLWFLSLHCHGHQKVDWHGQYESLPDVQII